MSFCSIVWDPLRKLLNLGEMIVDLKGMGFLVHQTSWSLKEKPGTFQEGKKELSGPRTGPWIVLRGKKTSFEKNR